MNSGYDQGVSEPRVSSHLRRSVAMRASRCCEYCSCQERYSPDTFSVEHIVPLSQGGPTELANLAYSCQGCNGHKATRTSGIDPLTKKIAPLYHPRQHPWQEHFLWSDDYLSVLGRTPTGHATIELLRLNREPVVNLRRLLCAAGQHPPPMFRLELTESDGPK